jgi:hypothetical protein
VSFTLSGRTVLPTIEDQAKSSSSEPDARRVDLMCPLRVVAGVQKKTSPTAQMKSRDGLHRSKNMLQQTRFLQTVRRDIKRNKRHDPRLPISFVVQHEIEHMTSMRGGNPVLCARVEIIRPNQTTKAYPFSGTCDAAQSIMFWVFLPMPARWKTTNPCPAGVSTPGFL